VADWKKLLKDILLADGIIDEPETEYLKRSFPEDETIDKKLRIKRR